MYAWMNFLRNICARDYTLVLREEKRLDDQESESPGKLLHTHNAHTCILLKRQLLSLVEWLDFCFSTAFWHWKSWGRGHSITTTTTY